MPGLHLDMVSENANAAVETWKAEFDRLKREGRCFRCKNIGHLIMDCPEEEEEVAELNAANIEDETQSSADSEADDVKSAEKVEAGTQMRRSEGSSSLEEEYRYPNDGMSDSSD
ncbi:hypothetical protein C8R45DRAFT_1095870 [Mycena sanguinolenta]|nr:hypothetical protein C8R45DRAFT_1095870 [Mycena sanguinolenta]